MKITFIDIPNWMERESVERVFGCNLTIYPVPNVFTLIIAAILRDGGHRVNYIDCANYYWSQQQFKDFLYKDDSDLLGIHSVNLSKQIDLFALEKIREIKRFIPVVFTGPAPTYFVEEFLKDENVYVIRGEPEFTFKELVSELSQPINKRNLENIDGLSYLKNAMLIHNNSRLPISDLDFLPFPARELLDQRLYFNPKIGLNPWTVLLASRGCSYRCIYCVPCSLNFAREIEYKRFYNCKPPVRLRSVRNIIEEFRVLKKQGYRSISIIDDNFIWGEKRTLELCEGIKNLGIQWGCLARADHITERITKSMAEAGCQYIDLGVESFNQDVLDYIHKDLKVQRIYEAINIMKKYRIGVKLNILLGTSPIETEEIILENLRRVKELKPSTVMFSIVSPFPGTEFYNIVKENNWFDKEDYYPTYLQKKATISYPNLSSKDLNRLIRRCNYNYYLSPSFIMQGLKRIKSFRGLLSALAAYGRKLNFK